MRVGRIPAGSGHIDMRSIIAAASIQKVGEEVAVGEKQVVPSASVQHVRSSLAVESVVAASAVDGVVSLIGCPAFKARRRVAILGWRQQSSFEKVVFIAA